MAKKAAGAAKASSASQVQKHNVSVAYTETKQAEAQFCEMVPKTITVPILDQM